MRTVRRLCVLWARLGPYHTARLRALRSFLDARDVELVALEATSDDEANTWGAERDDGAFRRVTALPGRSFESVPAREIEASITLALDRIDPDAVAIPSYSTPDARAALGWARRRRRVAVMMFDSRREDADRAGWREAVKRALVRQFDAALVAGGPQRAYAVELGIPASHAFDPLDVVDNHRFARLAEAARRKRDPAPRFLCVSRLIPVKGVDVLLEAHARYRGDGGTWPLVVVGDGPERARLEAAAGEGVTFVGAAQGDDLAAWYGRTDALVVPSRKDTWGLVVNEAMAAGLPVIVSTGAGCEPDLVEHGRNGVSVPPDDPASLAEALGWVDALLEAERAALGRRSREIIGQFGLDDFCRGLWAAVEAGDERSGRGLTPTGRIVLAALRLVARRAASFHATPT